MSHRQFIERIFIALAIVLLALLAWRLRHLLMLVVGAILVAFVLRVIAAPIRERIGLRDSFALLIAILLVAGLIGAAALMFGAEVASQTETLKVELPAAWRYLLARLEPIGLAEPLEEWMTGVASGSGIGASIGRLALSVGNAAADTLLVIFGGIYLAAQPELYRVGLVKLFPKDGRPLASETLDDISQALRLWLLGRLVSMAIVGLLTGIGLWLIGVPAALTLAIVAALLEFVPYVGPILSSIPAILLALLQGPEVALWTAGLFLIVQQIEGNVVEPLVQQRAVMLPPALLLFGLVAGGLLFGVAGVLFAAPLLVILYVAVKRLYVQEALHTATPLPTDRAGE